MRVELYIRLLLATAGIMLCGSAHADTPTIRASFSRDSIEVGDRFDFVIDIEKDRATEIGVPDLRDHITKAQAEEVAKSKANMSTFEEYDEDKFELITDYPIDTLKVEGRRLHLRKRYHLAAMETGTMRLRPSILYFQKNHEQPDTIYGDQTLELYVARYEQLDTTSFLIANPQMGVKVDSLLTAQYLRSEGLNEVKNLPFVFREVQDYVIYGVMIAIVMALLIWLIVILILRYIRRRGERVKTLPKLPAHVVANMALVELNHRKLWQNGKFKQYYTSLSSILRVYISDRWDIGALEMTTDEIIESLVDKEIPRDSRMDLVAVLRTADMVKFAKAQPESEENETNYTRSYYFVENTKCVVEEHNTEKGDITIETKIND